MRIAILRDASWRQLFGNSIQPLPTSRIRLVLKHWRASKVFLPYVVSFHALTIDIWKTLNTLVSSASMSDSAEHLKNFLVPYDKNEQFTGRTNVLRQLREMLCEVVPKQQSHRVALHGMGGIGKTQIAIAYAHEYKDQYNCTFWISAASEATLHAGFRDIAIMSGCVSSPEVLDAKVLVAKVLQWFRIKDNWLLVIDNLDYIELIDGYLPDRSPTKHTLITTRNPDAKGIPARGLEVPLMTIMESIEMLYTLSDMSLEFDTVDPMAEKIVEEVGYLPLAIGQAAAFIREVTRSFETFLDDYRTHRKELYEFVSSGNRQYSYSIASTWSLSFN